VREPTYWPGLRLPVQVGKSREGSEGGRLPVGFHLREENTGCARRRPRGFILGRGFESPRLHQKTASLSQAGCFLFIVDKFTVDDQKLLFTDNGSIYDYSTGVFVYQKKLSLSSGYIFCGHGRIAVARNTTDDVDFYDYDGNL